MSESVSVLAVAWLQGLYFAVTGIWPLISISTFQKVTGPKHDLWLVQTVGVLITVIGATLIYAAARQIVDTPMAFLAVCSAAGLAAVDVVFVARRIIPRIYLVDAAAEAVLILAWIGGLLVAAPR